MWKEEILILFPLRVRKVLNEKVKRGTRKLTRNNWRLGWVTDSWVSDTKTAVNAEGCGNLQQFIIQSEAREEKRVHKLCARIEGGKGNKSLLIPSIRRGNQKELKEMEMDSE